MRLLKEAQPLIGSQLEEESLTTKSYLGMKNDAWHANDCSRRGQLVVKVRVQAAATVEILQVWFPKIFFH